MPVIKGRRAMQERGEEMPDDMLQWMLDESVGEFAKEDEEVAFWQLTLSMAAIHTTTMTITQMWVSCHSCFAPRVPAQINIATAI